VNMVRWDGDHSSFCAALPPPVASDPHACRACRQVTESQGGTLLMHLPEQMLSEIFRRVFAGNRTDLGTWMCLGSVCRYGEG